MKKKIEKRTYADRRDYIIKAVQKRRKRVRGMAIKYKGGKCRLCGYCRCKRALEFHHIGSRQKDFGISAKGYTRSWERTKKELDKCLLVCANCHREIHDGIRQLPAAMLVENEVNCRKPKSRSDRE